MEEPPVTIEKKCPRCGSENMQCQRVSHGSGAGDHRPITDKHQFKCLDCSAMFHFRGATP